MYKILIVEDDNTIAERLASHLKKWNYKTVCVRDFKNVMEEFKKTDPQLVILDIGLPFYNGFYWCQEIRKLSNVPIIFLSSMNDNMNIVMAMNMGGDEFIEKPFDLNVVTAKVQAVLRRAYALQGTANMIEHGEMLLNLGDASLTISGRKLLVFSGSSFKMCMTRPPPIPAAIIVSASSIFKFTRPSERRVTIFPSSPCSRICVSALSNGPLLISMAIADGTNPFCVR